MKWKEARVLAMQEVKITHKDYPSYNWLIMRGNLVIFENGDCLYEDEFVKDISFLQDGWFEFE